MKKHNVKIDAQKCVGCGACARVCAAHNVVVEGKTARTVLDDCIFCGQCAAVCPRRAIAVTGYDREPVERPRKRASIRPKCWTLSASAGRSGSSATGKYPAKRSNVSSRPAI